MLAASLATTSQNTYFMETLPTESKDRNPGTASSMFTSTSYVNEGLASLSISNGVPAAYYLFKVYLEQPTAF